MNSAFGDMWNGFYEGIADCNLCLEGMKNMDEKETAQLKGEVYALRAFSLLLFDSPIWKYTFNS